MLDTIVVPIDIANLLNLSMTLRPNVEKLVFYQLMTWPIKGYSKRLIFPFFGNVIWPPNNLQLESGLF